MCGIVGYIGHRRVLPIILEGLKRLEYRGYDSAGLVYLDGGRLVRCRCQGKLSGLEEKMDKVVCTSCIGLGHTRWATHGAPSESNAHPHTDCSGELSLVHNGIIENYQSLRSELLARGHRFSSETDTEILAHLIEDYLEDDLETAVRKAIREVEGSFAIGVIWSRQPDRLVAVRYQSPLVLGIQGPGGCLMASDIPAVLPYTRDVVFLDDGEMAVLKENSWEVLDCRDGRRIDKVVQRINWNAAMAEKAGYRHFMLKEIFEQPQAILNTFRGRLEPESGEVNIQEIGLEAEEIKKIRRISLVACGTSWHAALIAKYWLEKWAGIPVDVDIASEFRYRRLILGPESLVITISQSGETADTLAGLRLAQKMGARVLTICNVVGSTMTREADGTIYTHAGPEIGVASTKAFTSQLTALFLLTLHLGRVLETISFEQNRELVQALVDLPQLVDDELSHFREMMDLVAEEFSRSRDFLYLGRGINFPVALEGALKLKEISYIHAEGYAVGELKHGPIALIDRDMPVLALVPPDGVYNKLISNVEEVRARHGRLILVGSRNDHALTGITDYVIGLPEVHEELTPILYTIPLQLLSYQIAHIRGCDVDQPRNLAKSVTVE
ncbi:MAG: glutamine--fructose-6-phosphate transaminase (isomerizing) [Desulfobia sp.]